MRFLPKPPQHTPAPSSFPPARQGLALWLPRLLWLPILSAAALVLYLIYVYTQFRVMHDTFFSNLAAFSLWASELLKFLLFGSVITLVLALFFLQVGLWRFATYREKRARARAVWMSVLSGLLLAFFLSIGALIGFTLPAALSFACNLGFCLWLFCSNYARRAYGFHYPWHGAYGPPHCAKKRVRVALGTLGALFAVILIVLAMNLSAFLPSGGVPSAAASSSQFIWEEKDSLALYEALIPTEPLLPSAKVLFAPQTPQLGQFAMLDSGDAAFFTYSGGLAYRLPKGNILEYALAPGGHSVYFTIAAGSLYTEKAPYTELYVFTAGGRLQRLAQHVGRMKLALNGAALYYTAYNPKNREVAMMQYSPQSQKIKQVGAVAQLGKEGVIPLHGPPAWVDDFDETLYDFALAPNGAYLLYKSEEGLIRYSTVSGESTPMADADQLPAAISGNGATMVWCNPGRTLFQVAHRGRYVSNTEIRFSKLSSSMDVMPNNVGRVGACHTNASGSQMVLSGPGGVYFFEDGALIRQAEVEGQIAILGGDYMRPIQQVGGKIESGKDARCIITEAEDIGNIFFSDGGCTQEGQNLRFYGSLRRLLPNGEAQTILEGSLSIGLSTRISISQNGLVLNLLDDSQKLRRMALYDDGKTWERLVGVKVTSFAASKDGGATYHLSYSDSDASANASPVLSLYRTGPGYTQQRIATNCVLYEDVITNRFGTACIYGIENGTGNPTYVLWTQDKGIAQQFDKLSNLSDFLLGDDVVLPDEGNRFFYASNVYRIQEYGGLGEHLYYYNGSYSVEVATIAENPVDNLPPSFVPVALLVSKFFAA